MTGEQGSQILTFLADFLRTNDGNTLNKYITEPFIAIFQKRLNVVAEADLKVGEEHKKKIEELKSQIENLNATITYLTAEPTPKPESEIVKPIKEVLPLKPKIKKDISEETVKEVMEEVEKK